MCQFSIHEVCGVNCELFEFVGCNPISAVGYILHCLTVTCMCQHRVVLYLSLYEGKTSKFHSCSHQLAAEVGNEG